ncbi:hypothetical protein LIER_42308 [Lithospermum erythrorhizon]|uniref:Uncharacterized protein n=1 Tax=Lithospermum erythrorhizon TaxID=34254 RepID=A0AAV3RMI0_LITER
MSSSKKEDDELNKARKWGDDKPPDDTNIGGIILFGLIGATTTTIAVTRLRRTVDFNYSEMATQLRKTVDWVYSQVIFQEFVLRVGFAYAFELLFFFFSWGTIPAVLQSHITSSYFYAKLCYEL